MCIIIWFALKEDIKSFRSKYYKSRGPSKWEMKANLTWTIWKWWVSYSPILVNSWCLTFPFFFWKEMIKMHSINCRYISMKEYIFCYRPSLVETPLFVTTLLKGKNTFNHLPLLYIMVHWMDLEWTLLTHVICVQYCNWYHTAL